jgi:organic radical activating enzyme
MRYEESDKYYTMYDMETETGNFFANGLLVHNCHWCDTMEVMDMENATEMEIPEVASKIKEWLGTASTSVLVITGGEPLLYEEDVAQLLVKLLLEDTIPEWVEMETNGTFFPSPKIVKLVNQFNVSPKLPSANAGSSFQPEVIKSYVELAQKGKKVAFKFVVGDQQDMAELQSSYLPLIPASVWDSIWLMPCGSTREVLNEVYPKVVEFAKDLGVNFSPRLHVNIWDKTTGV